MKHLLIIFLLISYNTSAQEYTQTVKGRILDGQSLAPLSKAKIEILDSGRTIFFTKSDSMGYFAIQDVPIGRITIYVTVENYTENTLYNINHVSGKETVLNIEMFESYTFIKGSSVKTKSKKDLNNSSISLSAKSFDIEETRRYAGSRNDPARMASNFAGVVGNNDSRNDIIIRGNSPQGLLWRMEGIDIPNPSHFGAMGASGGPVTILNNNVLSKSDFLTGAFPAEYGNASAGVFDLKMRNGNSSKHEFTGQIGFNGFEAGAEGPINKKSKASYLINYRYSTLAVLQRIGLNFGTGTAIPYYQDLSFKLNIPIKKDRLSIFGIGGLSNIHFENQDSQDSSNLYSNGSQDLKYKTSMGVIGASYLHFISKKIYINTSIGYTFSGVKTSVDSVGENARVGVYRDNSNSNRLVLNSSMHIKHSSSKQFIVGINVQNIAFNFNDSVRNNQSFRALRSDKGNTFLLQLYSNYTYKLNARSTLNIGLHYQRLTLNGSDALEPRIGLVHQISKRKKISFASGMHSQIQNLQVYYLKTTIGQQTIQTNLNLGLNKSAHFVAAYEYSINKNWKMKSEAYYQYVYNIPVTSHASYYSVINEGADFNTPGTDSLINKGTGQNYGLELTLERFFNKGFYALNSISLYNSLYTGSNGIEKNTAYNGNFIVNLLGGKEFKISQKSTLNFDTKISLAGGRRYTPINLQASKIEQKEVLYTDQTFEKQFATYFRLDLKLTYRRSGKKITQEWFLDVQNVSNRKNVFLQAYDPIKQTINTQYQLGLFPNFNYRINF